MSHSAASELSNGNSLLQPPRSMRQGCVRLLKQMTQGVHQSSALVGHRITTDGVFQVISISIHILSLGEWRGQLFSKHDLLQKYFEMCHCPAKVHTLFDTVAQQWM